MARTPIITDVKIVWYFIFMMGAIIGFPDRQPDESKAFWYFKLTLAVVFAPGYVLWGVYVSKNTKTVCLRNH